MTEIWKDIPGYEGLYQGSTEGRIKSLSRTSNRITKYGEFRCNIPERILKGRPARHGYLNVVLYSSSNKLNIAVHRLIALTFHNNPESKPYVNHINGVKNDNRVENLEWCTQKENMQHAWRIGKCKPKPGDLGEKSPHAKLKEYQVLEIRAKYSSGNYSQSALGREYLISRRHISDIVNRICWPHI